jgi:hypothetical protein
MLGFTYEAGLWEIMFYVLILIFLYVRILRGSLENMCYR